MTSWNEIKLPGEEERLWELFHENSKLSPFSAISETREDMKEMIESFHVSLPVQSVFSKELESRQDQHHELYQRVFWSPLAVDSPPASISFETLSCILKACSAVMVHSVSSGIAISPLEIYCFQRGIDGMPDGLYHFDPHKQIVQLMETGISAGDFSEAIPRTDESQVYLFITALFQRTAIFFGERGYRIALTMSGQVVQNIILSCAMQSLQARPVISFYDRKVERMLGLDGVDHSVLQVIAI
jgi:SagB-type dehydrogenase family enzyme